MKVKPTVLFDKVGWELGYAIGICEMIYGLYGEQLVVTSLNDSTHSAGSLHYKGRAADLRTRNIQDQNTKLRIFQAIKAKLEPLGFDVVQEVDHTHVEFDPKPGERLVTVVA